MPDYERAGGDGSEHTARMNQNFRKSSRATGSNFPVDTLSDIDYTRPNGPSPALVPKAVLSRVERERASVIRLD